MKIGILYDANNYFINECEKDFSLLSEVTKIQKGLEDCSCDTVLIEGIDELIYLLSQPSHNLSLILNLITWTRSNKKTSPVSILNHYRMPYIGNSLEPLVICANKYITKLLAMELNIPVPKYIFENNYMLSTFEFEYISQILKMPFVMKANGTSGSLGVKVINDKAEFEKTRNEFRKKWNAGILYEEYINGIDITVPVLSMNNIASPLQTIKYLDSHGNDIPFFTREIKYYEDIRGISYDCCLHNAELVKKYALLIHNQIGCRIFSRSDFRLTPNGDFYFLECNATPDLNPQGAFVIASKMTYKQLLLHIINESVQ